jgi:hypothetical protein
VADQDVIAALEAGSGRLLAKLLTNEDLCNQVMAATAVMALELDGSKAAAVKIGDVEMTGRAMKAKVTMDFAARRTAAALPDLPDSGRLLDHIGQENRLFYEFVRAHPDVQKWLRQVIEKMDTYALVKGVPFSSLSFGDHGAYMTIDGNYIVLELAE